MVNPSQVKSPLNRIEPGSVRVVYTANSGGWSVTKLNWWDEATSSYDPALAIRWNGELNDPNDLGHPRSHGHPTWFILPTPIALLVQAFIDATMEEDRDEARAVLAAEGINMDAVDEQMRKLRNDHKAFGLTEANS
jgi:hypothetical protein